LNRLQTSLGVEPLAWSPEARDAFTELLQSSDASPALEAMDATGFLAALIPEWTGVRCLPQRDLYHRFTVDMHLFETAAELASSRACDETLVRDAWSRVASSAPLFVAALLHDIGKGRGGDHSAIGARVARDVGVRMGLPAADVDDVAFLVERHLALASLATRRDLNEPRTIASAAAQAGTASRLAMLYLLTRADSKATGPEAWTTFRAALVGELYAKTMALLEGRPAAAGTERPRPEDALLSSPLSDGDVRTMVAERDDVHEFVLVARDRPGLFASVCGVLALRGVDVHDAEIYTREDGVAVEVFRVTGSHGEIPKERWDRVVRDLESLFGGALDLEDALSRKAGQERHRRPAHKRGGRVRVVVDNDASPTHTVVEVHAPDHLGLLHEVTKALYRASCDVSVAKIATYGADVVDVFYVRDLQGGRITSPEQVAGLEAALRAASAR
jgi:[protein-PII] uridylyltransferase